MRRFFVVPGVVEHDAQSFRVSYLRTMGSDSAVSSFFVADQISPHVLTTVGTAPAFVFTTHEHCLVVDDVAFEPFGVVQIVRNENIPVDLPEAADTPAADTLVL